MSIRARVWTRLWLGAATLLLSAHVGTAVGAGMMSPNQTDPTKPSSVTDTQTATLPLTTTDFASNSPIPGNPLVFQQFDTASGARTLESVTLTVHARIQNDYTMGFITPATITDSVASGNPNVPGPSITMYQPDGKTPLLSVGATDTSSLSRSITYGGSSGQALPQEFSSSLPSNSPFYIAPSVFDKTQTLTLTNPADLALFTGKGTLSLPVAASAFSSFQSTSGNGYGRVTTTGTADVTVGYTWHDTIPAPQNVPEPSAVVLWGLGGLTLALRYRLRARRAGAC